MQGTMLSILARAILLSAMFSTLQACTPASINDSGVGVAAAYETSGMIAVPAYTRSIYNTHNF